MKNGDISYALAYHQATKHSETNVRTSTHYLDWENRPLPFKIYHDLPSTPLPRDFPKPQADTLASIFETKSAGEGGQFGMAELAELLFFSAGLTRRFRHGGELHYMRAASATGALYPIELYVVCQDIQGLKAGVYHFNPLEFALVQIRSGDYRAEVAHASSETVNSAPATIVFTSFAWRNAWKYEARSYRHWFWDGGVITANLLAVATSMGLETRIVAGFVDEVVNRLLGMNTGKEAAVFLVPVDIGHATAEPRPLRRVSSVEPKVRPLSRREVDYPEIWTLHEASSLSSADEVKRWVGQLPDRKRESSRPSFPQTTAKAETWDRRNLGDVILQRGSTRRFARATIKFSQLSLVLKSSTTEVPLDFIPAGESLIDTYLVANAVEGLPSGSYHFNREAQRLEQLKTGQMRQMSSYLCLEQPLFSDASVVFFLMTSLQDVLKALGNRGYRAAQLEGGIIAGRIYLSAYSVGLGASGSTFYDDAVTEFFSPHARDKNTVIAVGIGVPAYGARPGKILPRFPLEEKIARSYFLS